MMIEETKGVEKLSDEELDAVVGGSHISSSEIQNYVGKDVTYYWGGFCSYEHTDKGAIHIEGIETDAKGRKWVICSGMGLPGNDNYVKGCEYNGKSCAKVLYTGGTLNWFEEA